ncbi:MAG: aminotransferase class IV [Gemmataceae bacterium]
MAEALAYLNGRRLPAAQAALPIFDAGLVLGATVSELTRTFNGVPFRLDDHLDRLFRGLDYVGIEIAQGQQDLRDIALELAAHNYPLVAAGSDLGIIHFVTPGPYPTYMPAESMREPTVCVHTFPLPCARWARRVQEGAKLVTTSVRDVPAACVARSVKQRSRLHYHLADQAARRQDPEALALLQDEEGFVTETATANLLIVKAGGLVSPRRERILPGISRDTALKLAGQLGLQTLEADLTVADVCEAEEAFLSSTPFCLMPVVSLNGVPIGSGRPGAVYERLLQAWSEQVGVDIAAQIQQAQ